MKMPRREKQVLRSLRSRRMTLAALGMTTLCSVATPAIAQRPSVFLSKAEAAAIRANATRYPLLASTIATAKMTLADAMSKPIDVPQPG